MYVRRDLRRRRCFHVETSLATRLSVNIWKGSVPVGVRIVVIALELISNCPEADLTGCLRVVRLDIDRLILTLISDESSLFEAA